MARQCSGDYVRRLTSRTERRDCGSYVGLSAISITHLPC